MSAMKYENASHVDYSGLLGRRANIGLPLAILGALLIPVSICGRLYIDINILVVFTFLLWLLAWYLIVGTLYRLPITAAFLIQLIIVTCLKLGYL